ncbi:hypothetical protein ACRALDRAFT_2131570 [Sodiomyces alcalophilus JCM 7366]|uniref:uncharacterized protein n=1 Tax=Sodiomyces alcalophilus JCM 7366 TaxID=591952 RepID=UPI0039B506FB
MNGSSPGPSGDVDDVCLSGVGRHLNNQRQSRSNAIVGARFDPRTTASRDQQTKRRPASEPSRARSRYPISVDWELILAREIPVDREHETYQQHPPVVAGAFSRHLYIEENKENHDGDHPVLSNEIIAPQYPIRRTRPAGRPYSTTLLVLVTSLLGVSLLCTIINSSWARQMDDKGCRMSYMRPSYIPLREFDTEHTRFAAKYSLYLYREQGIDHEQKLRGVPVLFIPGNAGSYRQVRPIAAEAANYFQEVLHRHGGTGNDQHNLDFFTVDFNEDITAFHGQTLLDQAEYLNEAIRYILSLYMHPNLAARNIHLPDPCSVLILGHSMGGIVARAMLSMPNYQSHSINTIITMSAPHARAPVTSDSRIVSIYNDINGHWRGAYSQKWASDNPLWHVTLVSIAGGDLDTVVPSDFASIESIVPETHGFTVFTSGIPRVWTSMDHQAILWCDQFRKVVARALYDVLDVHRPSQTKPRAERMRIFRKWFLTGMESSTEKMLPLTAPTTSLALDDDMSAIVPPGERLVLRRLGESPKPHAYLLPIPPQGSLKGTRLTLLADGLLHGPGEYGEIEVLFCSASPLQHKQSMDFPQASIRLSEGSKRATELICKNAATDSALLPALATLSRPDLSHERPNQPFSYLQYEIEDLVEHDFVVVIDKAVKRTDAFVVAEFSDLARFYRVQTISLSRLLLFGMSWTLPSGRPVATEISIPSIQSSLIAYDLEIIGEQCNGTPGLFAPAISQHLTQPYESKFFTNAKYASLSIHGVAPFIPPPMPPKGSNRQGLSLQFWTDPTCSSNLEVRLTVDVLGSLGKLVLRYRTVFVAFPLLVMSLVLRNQFMIYDSHGVFISFTESLDSCLRHSLPLLLSLLTILSFSLKGTGSSILGISWHWWFSDIPALDFHSNDLLIGTRDSFFWYLVPLIGVICTGVCAILHYATVALTLLLGAVWEWAGSVSVLPKQDNMIRAEPLAWVPSSLRRRILTTTILMLLVSAFIPYQFAYLVACLVQLLTTARGLRIATSAGSPASRDFYNYTHSILLLMLWVLPINLPILAVWIRNITVYWLTPFSSHHNLLSILPFIVLVENMTTGRMVPRAPGNFKHFTSVLLFGTGVCAAIYGVSYAYMLHYVFNLVAAWLVIIYSTSYRRSVAGVGAL